MIVGKGSNSIKKAMTIGVFLFFTPVVGIAFLLIGSGINKAVFSKQDDLLQEEEQLLNQNRIFVAVEDDVAKDLDRVAIEEAFIISDTEGRRKALLDVLKRPDAETYINSIKGAMNNEDSEVAHYAASYVADTMEKYKTRERDLRKLHEEEKDLESLVAYLDFSGDMLHRVKFSLPEQERYLKLFEAHMEELYALDAEQVKGGFISDVIGFLKKKGDKQALEKWVNRAEGFMESDIDSAKEVLKYYYSIGNTKGFNETINKIKGSPLVLDSELVEWIRFF
ncbi:MAG: hypothetical protein IJR47_00010 [Clostridia bacterium]|nr:hypothetical protein [Clostridia bacterium]